MVTQHINHRAEMKQRCNNSNRKDFQNYGDAVLPTTLTGSLRKLPEKIWVAGQKATLLTIDNFKAISRQLSLGWLRSRIETDENGPGRRTEGQYFRRSGVFKTA